MANGSEGKRKQTEPEGKQTSQVRLEWERDTTEVEDLFAVHTHCAGLVVHQIDVSSWKATVIATNLESMYCATKEEAQLWCESKLTELLAQDLKLLGG